MKRKPYVKVVSVHGLDIEVTRKQVTTVRLTVRKGGDVRVTAPFSVQDETIERFIIEKWDWIDKKRNVLKDLPDPEKEAFEEGDSLFFEGKPYTIVHVPSKSRGVSIDGNRALVFLKEGDGTSQRRATIKKWYRERLAESCELLVPKWERITGLQASEVVFRDMKTRWGSCNTLEKKICLNINLMRKPEVCLEYVILHELTHLRWKGHDHMFWQAVAEHMPDYRQIKKLLNNSY